MSLRLEPPQCWGRVRWSLVVCSLLCGCSVYDPQLAKHATSNDAGARVDAASGAPEAGADAAVYFDDDGGDASFGCRPNPDPSDESCPEICPEICNGLDDDCDGEIDEDADATCGSLHAVAICRDGQCLLAQCNDDYRDCDDLAVTGCEVAPTDPENCGTCGHVCAIANASAACSQGQCVVAQCESGYADCDGDARSCETRTNTLTQCGGCDTPCKNVPHALPSCDTGTCGVASCLGGYGDCDHDPSNGCEQPLDTLSHCGGCDTTCNKANCGGGICTAADCSLTPGFADCDHDEATCETDLHADPNNCGACGYRCAFSEGVSAHAALGCNESGCFADCEPGYGDCDGDFTNGCETKLDTLSNCGACGQACAIANADATCSTGACRVDSCKPGFADCDADGKSCETALDSPDHCGSCDTVCDLPNANEGCGGSVGARVCTVATCASGYADCDGNAANGCERDVRAVAAGGLGPCLPDNSCVKSTSAGHEYYVCPTARTWSEARSRCQLQAGGDLAQIGDATEDGFLKSRIASTSWVGDSDTTIEGLWVWVRTGVPFWRGTASGSTLSGRYANWASGEPNGSGNCGALYTSGQFDDASCGSSLPFVCEVSPDGCPSDANKDDPGQCGCGNPDTDTDSDGVADCQDGCPSDANKLAPGICGCGTADIDSDGDGTANCKDGCATDPNKTSPGACGCGVPDVDTDNDGALDCKESCDNDPAKTDPGACGCGVPDTDSDGDGVADCLDGCPSDPTLTTACFPFSQSNFSVANIDFSTTPSATLNCGTTTVDTSTNPATLSNWCGTAPPTYVQAQSGGPELTVLALKGLNIASGSTLRVIGSRPLALAVRGDATIDGTIDASASGTTPGAGGHWSCGSSAGGDGSGSAALFYGGGGGGGGAFGTSGGRGGQGDGKNNYGSGGATRGNANLVPLYGGCPGGNGGGCSSSGGAGGGAVQLSVSGTLDVNGTIRANGADGENGCGTEGGGAGGGSGGAILLEASTRDTSGANITANGGRGGNGVGLSNGGGGGGSTSSGSSGSSGGDASGAGGGGGGGYGRIKN